MLAGVIGLGVYFHFSGRVWCRFFCPLAALMHIYARFSPYRIMANKKRCISCNICTKVCHMGIDVMNFANKGIPMNDVQCVRCSACIVNCPLQVLTFGAVGSTDLENKKYKNTGFPLARGWQSGLLQKDIDMLVAEEETPPADPLRRSGPGIVGAGFEPAALLRRIESFPDRLHALSVDSHVAVAEPRGRSELNCFCAVVEHEFHIVDKPPQKRSEFNIEIVACVRNDPGAGQRIDHPNELLLCLIAGPGVGQWFDGVGLVGCKSRYAIG